MEALTRETKCLFGAFEESDRGLALVVAEFFDVTLERLLRARFSSALEKQPKLIKPLFEGFGPLSTFSSKISVSYASDLIQDWMASELHVIRRIRNEFAHSLESKTFLDPKISRMVDNLASLAQAVERIEKTSGWKKGKPKTSDMTTRYKFVMVCVRTGALLQSRVAVLESHGLEEMKRIFTSKPYL